MTSITHAASSTFLPGRSASSAARASRFRFAADSKAVRVGLGVAIAAVMAGDVYAVLRSPVSEGGARSTDRSSATASAAGRSEAIGGGAGFVPATPFGEAAYGAELAGRIVAPVAAASVGGGVVPSVAPAAPAMTAPVGAVPAPAGGIVLAPAPVVGPVSSIVPPATSPSGGPQDPGTGATPEAPATSPLAPVVEAIRDVPAVGETVAPVIEEVVAEVPVAAVEEELAPVASAVPVPVAVPSGLSL